MSALIPYTTLTVVTQAQLAQRDPLFVLKGADQTLNNVSALTNDSALFVTAAASATYELRAHLIQNSGATPGFKVAVTLPAGATWQPGTFMCGSSAGNLQFGDMSSASINGVTGAGTDAVVDFATVVVIAGTAGTVQIQWAQNVANASNTIVRAGSYLLLRQVA